MRDSADVLTDPPPPAADARIAYGPEPLQFGDLRVPPGDGPFPLALVLHGGYWQATYNLIHLGHLCEALRDAGIASWNLEYRRLGDPGGEWPAAAEDLKLALAHFDRLPFARDGRTLLIGHSAGGQLALWAAKRSGLPVLALAPVSDVRDSVASRGPESASARYMAPERFLDGSPIELLPLGARQIVIHGTADDSVPYEMSVRYAAVANNEAELITLPGSGHFEPIDPRAPEFAETLAAIRRLL
ncbi:MAG TPA: alpha/beta fold hydrolase [Gaiellaceae bacterium]|jgi:pimeloyl-ACP methyl ester carboxylesterase|nr:alpha/beta fold hydrolase [Gaiellaceae bacterium]